MINSYNLDLYKAVGQELKLTEFLVSSGKIKWNYSLSSFEATLIKAADLNLFDKTILELLKIEDFLSLEDIGEILGFNVINNPDDKKYLDTAEYEILKEALQELEQFEMIKVGDIHFSKCNLTEIGRDYAEKGKKFQTLDKREKFTLYFDDTSKNHLLAKENFEGIKGDSIQYDHYIHKDDYIADYQIVQAQQPDIHNYKTMNSFIHPELEDTLYYELEVEVLVITDIEHKTNRFIAWIPSSNIKHDYITSYINENKELKNEIYNQITKQLHSNNILAYSNSSYFKNLVQIQSKSLQLFDSERIKEALKYIKKEKRETLEFIKIYELLNNLENFITPDTVEFYIQIPEKLVSKVSFKKFIQKISNKSVLGFFQFPSLESVDKELIEYLEKTNNLYGSTEESINIIKLIIRKKAFAFKYEESIIQIPVVINQENLISESILLGKSQLTSNQEIFKLKEKFANDSLLEYAEEVHLKINDLSNQFLSKVEIQKLDQIDKRISPFYELKEHSNFESIKDLEEYKNKEFDNQIIKHEQKMTDDISVIKSEIENQMLSSAQIENYIQRVSEIKEELFDHEKSLISELENKLKIEEENLLLLTGKFTYIFEDAAVDNSPQLLHDIDNKQTIILTNKISNYINRNSNRNGESIQLTKAIKRRNVRLFKGKPTALSPVIKQQPHKIKNLISIGLHYKSKNAVIVTDDQLTKVLAETVGLSAISTKNLVALTKKRQQFNHNKTKK